MEKKMEFIRVTDYKSPLFERAMQLYETAFPLHEQRRIEHKKEVLKDEAYHFEAIKEDGEFAGLILYWEQEGFIYVEHFAIDDSLRGRNLGSVAMQEMCKRFQKVILEIDLPEDEISIRRKSFYERIGFCANPYEHIHPRYREQFAPHKLILMTSTDIISQDMYDSFNSYLKNHIMRYAD